MSTDSRTNSSASRLSNWRRNAPAAAGVVSVHSAGRDSTMRGRRPARAAWNAAAAPATPPPITTRSAAEGGSDKYFMGRRSLPDGLRVLLELRLLRGALERQGGGLPAGESLGHQVEVPRADLTLVLGGRVPAVLQLELPFLDPDVRGHALLRVPI